MKKTRRKVARRAALDSPVVITTEVDGRQIFESNPKAAAQLPIVDVPVLETKAETHVVEPEPAPAPVWTCDTCKRPGGTSADGKCVILFQRKSDVVCLDCVSAQHDKAATVGETKTGEMRSQISGPRGRRGKRPALNDDRSMTPSQHARAYALGKKRPPMRFFSPAKKSAIIENIATTYGLLAQFLEREGMPTIAEELKALRAATLEARAALLPNTKAALPVALFTSREMMEGLLAIERQPAKSVEQMITEKLAPLGLDAKAAREARIIEVVREDVMAESVPTGYSYATWVHEKNANDVNRKFRH